MTLEERYNAAGNDSYVGRVKAFQAADAGAIDGANFMDGSGKPKFAAGGAPAPDQVQTEFKRNAEGDFRYDGGGKVAGSYELSRWLPKGVNVADTYFVNNKFTTVQDTRNANVQVHKYSPLSGKSFYAAGNLSELAKGKFTGAPAGPSPAGVQG